MLIIIKQKIQNNKISNQMVEFEIFATLRDSISRGYLFLFVKKGHKYGFTLYHRSTLVLTAILNK